jgi:hypothetical protein
MVAICSFLNFYIGGHFEHFKNQVTCQTQIDETCKEQHPHLVERIGIGWTNFSAVALETKKGGFKKNLDSFHQTS